MCAYNTKLVKYRNGSAQIRRYSEPIRSKSPDNFYEAFSYAQETALVSCKVERIDFTDGSFYEDGYLYKDGHIYFYSPFDKAIVEMHDSNNKKEKKKESSNESDIIHSMNRAKRQIYSYASNVAWEYFLTFTFDGEKIDRYNYEECRRAVCRWLSNQRRNAPDLYYLAVPEQHKDGAWHFHAVIANVGKIKLSDSGKKDKKGRTIYNLSKWSLGFSTATSVGDIHKVAGYIAKYITKSLCESTKGKQRYFVSKGIPEPEISTFLVEDKCFDDFMCTMSDSLGMEIIHSSKPRYEGSFIDVDYYELLEKKDDTE